MERCARHPQSWMFLFWFKQTNQPTEPHFAFKKRSQPSCDGLRQWFHIPHKVPAFLSLAAAAAAGGLTIVSRCLGSRGIAPPTRPLLPLSRQRLAGIDLIGIIYFVPNRNPCVSYGLPLVMSQMLLPIWPVPEVVNRFLSHVFRDWVVNPTQRVD